MLARMFRRLFDRRKQGNVIMLGLDASGKTTILFKLIGGEFPNVIPTIGFNHEIYTTDRLRLDIWEVGGGSKMRPLYKLYFPGKHFLVFVIDSTDRERIGESREFAQMMVECPEASQLKVIFLANKQEVPGAMTLAEIEEAFAPEEWVQQPYTVIGFSAVTSENLNDVLAWMEDQLDD